MLQRPIRATLQHRHKGCMAHSSRLNALGQPTPPGPPAQADGTPHGSL